MASNQLEGGPKPLLRTAACEQGSSWDARGSLLQEGQKKMVRLLLERGHMIQIGS